MKKVIFILILASLVLVSCNQFESNKINANKEFSSVFIGIDGIIRKTREIGENGLPDLDSYEIAIKVVKEDESVLADEVLNPSDEKSLSVKVEVGETIKVFVKVTNASGEWTGEKTHTVVKAPKDNQIFIRIKKAVKSLRKLDFSLKEGVGSSETEFEIKFLEKPVFTKKIMKDLVPTFCRDNKARLYIAYFDDSEILHLARYNSEGDLAQDFSEKLKTKKMSEIKHLASDLITGKTYAITNNGYLYLINEDSLKKVEGVELNMDEIVIVAINSDKIFTVDDKSGSLTLNVFDIKSPSEVSNLYDLGYVESFKSYTDMMVHRDFIYLLRREYKPTCKSSGENVFSMGSIIRLEYDSVKNVVLDNEEFGKNTNKDPVENIISTADNCLYGPVKFIGFDENHIYIADDGVDFQTTSSSPIPKSNKNQIITLTLGEEPTIEFEASEEGILWFSEEEEKEVKEINISIGGYDD